MENNPEATIVDVGVGHLQISNATFDVFAITVGGQPLQVPFDAQAFSEMDGAGWRESLANIFRSVKNSVVSVGRKVGPQLGQALVKEMASNPDKVISGVKQLIQSRGKAAGGILNDIASSDAVQQATRATREAVESEINNSDQIPDAMRGMLMRGLNAAAKRGGQALAARVEQQTGSGLSRKRLRGGAGGQKRKKKKFDLMSQW